MARILIVDDEPLIAMLAADWLDELGHVTVGPAFSLDDATPLVEDDLDGAILDVSLGAGTSFALAERLKARGVPFAFATGYSAEDLGRGAVAVLAKPFDFESLSAVVGTLLGAASPPAGATRRG